MHMLFVDESGTPPPKEKIASAPYFVLGGVIISEEKWHDLNNGFNELKAQYKVEGEIKWRHFAPQKPQAKTNLAHLAVEEKEKLRSDIYALLNKFEIKALCMGCDVTETYCLNHINNSEDVYTHAYSTILAGFYSYLARLSKQTKGLIICDNRLPEQDNKLREMHSYFEKSIYKNIGSYYFVEGLLIAPSHYSLGIQLSDMVIGAVYRKITKDDSRFYNKIDKLLIKLYKTESKNRNTGIVHYQ